MLWLFEARVMFALLMVKLSETFTKWAADAYKDSMERAAQASAIPISRDPHSLEAMKRSQKVMAAIEAQDKAEEKWARAEMKLDARRKKYKQLNELSGRQVPGAIGSLQAWICAGVLTYYSPEWAAKIATFLHLGG